MIKLPTVKLNGQTAFVINRHQVEDDVAVAEAICRDAARYRWIRDQKTCPWAETDDAWENLDSAVDRAMNE